MVQNPPEGMSRVTPYLLYEDVDAAVDWLVGAFGFLERMRIKGPDDRASHAEVQLGDGLIMLGNPGPDFRNPKRLGGATQITYVYVDNVDRHYQTAKAAGARILNEPADQRYGDRTYRAEDPEGHHWSFAQHVRDVSTEEMHQPG
jgi:PhnB protein